MDTEKAKALEAMCQRFLYLTSGAAFLWLSLYALNEANDYSRENGFNVFMAFAIPGGLFLGFSLIRWAITGRMCWPWRSVHAPLTTSPAAAVSKTDSLKKWWATSNAWLWIGSVVIGLVLTYVMYLRDPDRAAEAVGKVLGGMFSAAVLWAILSRRKGG